MSLCVACGRYPALIAGGPCKGCRALIAAGNVDFQIVPKADTSREVAPGSIKTVEVYPGPNPARKSRKRAARPQGERVSEAVEQARGIRWLDGEGWTTWRCGQHDARMTQDAGVPDVIAMKPGVGLLFWEAKRPVGGRQSDAQKRFQEYCRGSGVAYCVGPVDVLVAAVQAFNPEESAA